MIILDLKFNYFILFYCLIKWFFDKDLGFILFLVFLSFYRRLVYRHLICRRLCYVELFIVLLPCFIRVTTI